MGFNKPGARGTVKSKTCPKCKGTGTPSKTGANVPCKTCKGTGTIFSTVPYPHDKSTGYNTDLDPEVDEVLDKKGDQIRKAVVKSAQWPEMTDKDKNELENHIWNLPPAKLVHTAKAFRDAERKFSMKELVREVSLVDRVRIKVPSSVKNSYLGIAKEFDGVSGRVIGIEKDGKEKLYRVKFDDPVMIDTVGEVTSDLFPASWLKESREQEQMYCPKCHMNVDPEFKGNLYSKMSGVCPHCGSNKLEPALDEMSAVGAVGGFNGPISSRKRKDEMKPFKKMVREAQFDLGKVDNTFTSFLEKKSKSGELQKQFGSGYSPDRLISWIRKGIEALGLSISEEYLEKFADRLTGNPRKDMNTAYMAFLKGAGLGLTEDMQ